MGLIPKMLSLGQYKFKASLFFKLVNEAECQRSRISSEMTLH